MYSGEVHYRDIRILFKQIYIDSHPTKIYGTPSRFCATLQLDCVLITVAKSASM